MLRDVSNYKVQFISIFLMAFIGVFVFSGMYVETSSFETTIDNYYGETNLADGWIYSNYLVDEFLRQVYLLGATTQMDRQLVVNSHADLENNPEIVLHFVENNTISKFYSVEGNEFDVHDADGVWLDKSFADARNLKVGDEISFKSNGTEIKKEIHGLGYSLKYVHDMRPATTVPNHTASGFAYMSHKAFPSGNIIYNVLDVKFEGTPEMYSKLLEYRLDGYYSSFLPKSSQPSVNLVSESISQHNSLASIFPPIFIILSMLILSSTLKRIISHQRTQIGVLKANGYKNISIAGYYILPGVFLVVLGSILGAIFGPIVFHMLANPSRIAYFKFPYWNFVDSTNSIILILFMGVISLLVSYYSINQVVNESPAMMMKPKVPKESPSSFFEELSLWNRLPFNFRWNYRIIRRNKFRAIMTVFGVIGCTVLLISGLGIYEQVGESKDWYFNDVNHFESKLILSGDAGLSQANSIAHNVNGSPIMESSVEILSNKSQMASLLVLNDTNLIRITDDNHNPLEIANDEVSISRKMADMMGIDVGDTINCHLIGSDKDVEIKIDKIHSSPFSQGLVMSPDKLRDLGFNFTPTSVVTSQHVNGSYDGVGGILYLNDLIDGWNVMEETSMTIIAALLFFAIVLAIVIIYNLNIMSFTEMEREIATLKVLGFKSSYLIRLLASQCLFFIIAGFLVGIPLAYYVLSMLVPAFGKDLYFLPSISTANLAITFAIMVSVSIVVNMFFSLKIRKLDMVESLKDLE